MKPAGRRQKGSRVERQIVAILAAAGIPSRRVVMSGAAARYDSRLRGDVDVGVMPEGAPLFRSEVKARNKGQGFSVLENWLGDNDILFLKRDRTTPFVAMSMEVFLQLMKVYWNDARRNNHE